MSASASGLHGAANVSSGSTEHSQVQLCEFDDPLDCVPTQDSEMSATGGQASPDQLSAEQDLGLGPSQSLASPDELQSHFGTFNMNNSHHDYWLNTLFEAAR
jgi:hypothetical protein